MVFQPIVLLVARDGRGLRGARPRPPPAARQGAARAAADRREHRARGGAEPAVPAQGGRAGRAAPRPADDLPEHAPNGVVRGQGCSSRSTSCARSPRSSTSRSRSTRACCRARRAIAELRGLLLERNIALAYDDFGAGQARLLELAEAPPHYLKFDHRFVSGLDQAPRAKRRLLESLLTLARELLVKTVAEGIETAAEARVCAEIGFTHAQGFHMGRPRPMDEL